MMAEKKGQHYVPQMYFRNFSENGKSIGGYLLGSRKFVENMPISGICKRDYLYGEDPGIENWLANLETKWAPILKKIIRQGNLDLTTAEWTLLLAFVFLSDARTAYTADASDDYTTKVIQAIIMTKRSHGAADYTDEQIRKIKMGMNIPNAAALRTVKNALLFFGDLSAMLIHNTTGRPFITSDNPVIKYNYLFATRNYHCNYGYGQVGILVFLPISPKYCLMIYDPSTYTITCENSVISIHAPDQCIELNKLFAANAKTAIYFHNSEREWVIERYAKGISDTSQKFNNQILQNNSGEQIVLSSNFSDFKKYKLNFIEIHSDKLHMVLPKNIAGPIRPEIRKLRSQLEKK